MLDAKTTLRADHIRNKLTQVNIQELTTDNSYEVWLKIRMLDMACDVPKECWVSQHDVAAHLGLRSSTPLQDNVDFEKVMFQTLMLRAHESETPPSIEHLVALYLNNVFHPHRGNIV